MSQESSDTFAKINDNFDLLDDPLEGWQADDLVLQLLERTSSAFQYIARPETKPLEPIPKPSRPKYKKTKRISFSYNCGEEEGIEDARTYSNELKPDIVKKPIFDNITNSIEELLCQLLPAEEKPTLKPSLSSSSSRHFENSLASHAKNQSPKKDFQMTLISGKKYTPNPGNRNVALPVIPDKPKIPRAITNSFNSTKPKSPETLYSIYNTSGGGSYNTKISQELLVGKKILSGGIASRLEEPEPVKHTVKPYPIERCFRNQIAFFRQQKQQKNS
jgi:hypothetical protein